MAKKTYQMNKIPLLWVLKRCRRRISGILLMTVSHVGEALLSVFFAVGMQAVIDSAVAGKKTAFYAACLQQGGLIVAMLLCLTLFRHLRDRLSADLERDWKKQLLHGLLHGEYAAVSGFHSAELLNRLNNDVARVNEGLLQIVPGAAAMAAKLIAAVIVLGTMDLSFMVVILLLGSLMIVATGTMRRYLKQINKKVNDHDGRVSGFLQEVMEKLLMVQAMDVTEEVEHRADGLLEDRYILHRKRKNLSLLANTGISILSLGLGFIALVWCSFRVLLGAMTFGTLSAVIHLVSQLRSPMMNISGLLPKYAVLLASAERLMELESIQGEPIAAREDVPALYDAMQTIGAKGLCFAYDQEQVIKDAEFSLRKGEFAVITGHSGIGKSTLLKLMLAVYPPHAGELFLQGEFGKLKLDRSTRRLFAYVPQGNLLLSGTLRENIMIANPQATEELLRHAVFVSDVESFLPLLPKGMDTVLGEDGAGISEGQAQRIAIARAVLGGAPILLLDECTSALDEETEKIVLQRLRALPGRTCIAVTHRPAALELCDRIIHIKDGAICVLEPI